MQLSQGLMGVEQLTWHATHTAGGREGSPNPSSVGGNSTCEDLRPGAWQSARTSTSVSQLTSAFGSQESSATQAAHGALVVCVTR